MTTTSDTTSAKALLDNWFAQTGITGLSQQAWTMLLQGDSPDQIVNWVRTTPEYAARYPAMAALNKSGRSITEAQYQNYEQSIYQMVQAAGLPKGMYDSPDQVAKMLTNDVSVSEAQSRMNLATAAAYTAPESVRNAMSDLYGVTPGHIVGLYLDSSKALPQLQKQYAAAQVAGAGAEQGIGINAATAENLAAQGVSYSQAQSGFGAVAATQALGRSLGGETADQNTRIQAQFGNAAAQTETARVMKGRLAAFQSAGTPAASNTGLKGLGSSTA